MLEIFTKWFEHTFWMMSEVPRLGAQLVDTASKYKEYENIDRGVKVPTIIIPGFSTTNASTYFMRRVLNQANHFAMPWCETRNVGFSPEVMERTIVQVKTIVEVTGKKVNLLGQSLGGCYARSVANAIPEHVNLVITMGTPINSLDLVHKNSIGKYDTVVGATGAAFLQYEEFFHTFNPNPSVPTTSLYSKSDGVVHWTNSIIPETDLSENVEIDTSHFGMGFDLETAQIVANRLAQIPEKWTKM